MSQLISVIIPVYNRPIMLREAVMSVLKQTYRPIEIIIIDDGSTDDTVNISKQLALEHKEIRVFHQKNQGPGVAREHGRLQAKGDFIQYLDSDDLLLPNKFSNQVSALEDNPKAQVCYGKEARFNFKEDLSIIDWSSIKSIKATGKKFDKIFPKLLTVNSLWGTSVPLWRTALTNKMGAWLPLINEEDIEYDARAGALNAKLVFVDQFVTIQRIHDKHLSSEGTTDINKLLDRLESREQVLDHALSSGLKIGSIALEHYSKNTFLLARMFAAQGMTTEMHQSMQLSEKASGKTSYQLVCYRLICRFLSSRMTQRLFTLLEKALEKIRSWKVGH